MSLIPKLERLVIDGPVGGLEAIVEDAGRVALVVPADVLLAIEIESPSSVTTDRITKPAQYAAGGIGHFWRLETAPLRLHTPRRVHGH